MNICFYADHNYWSQLNNTGGTATILRSIMALRKLGHKANVVAHKDAFSWFKHPKPIHSIPKNTDVCIAVTVSDIGLMLDSMPKKAEAYYWCRLVENHQIPKKKILNKAAKAKVLVNSENLYDWFLAHGIETKIAYQGVDVKKWKDHGEHHEKTIGFLVSTKKRKHFEVVSEIIRRLGSKYRYVGFGADLNREVKKFVNSKFGLFYINGGYKELSRIYNTANIWVVTSTKEGLHNPPIEAGLCGCAVVYPDAPLAGCSDHCIDGETAWMYEALNVDSAIGAIECADRSRNEKHKRLIVDKIGNRETAMNRLVRLLKC